MAAGWGLAVDELALSLLVGGVDCGPGVLGGVLVVGLPGESRLLILFGSAGRVRGGGSVRRPVVVMCSYSQCWAGWLQVGKVQVSSQQ